MCRRTRGRACAVDGLGLGIGRRLGHHGSSTDDTSDGSGWDDGGGRGGTGAKCEGRSTCQDWLYSRPQHSSHRRKLYAERARLLGTSSTGCWVRVPLGTRSGSGHMSAICAAFSVEELLEGHLRLLADGPHHVFTRTSPDIGQHGNVFLVELVDLECGRGRLVEALRYGLLGGSKLILQPVVRPDRLIHFLEPVGVLGVAGGIVVHEMIAVVVRKNVVRFTTTIVLFFFIDVLANTPSRR